MKFYKYILLLSSLFILGACSDDDPATEAESLVVDHTELSFTGYQTTQAIKVDATRRWSAVASDWWITVTPDGYPSAGQHFVVNVAITVSDNDTSSPRSGYVTFFVGDVEFAKVIISQDIQNEEDRPEEEYPITWANIQWWAADAIAEGSYFEAGCCVYANGVTNAMESTTGEDIVAQIGYCVDNTNPDGADWRWFDCWFNGDWGDNFYYQGRIEEELTAGTYYFTFRARNGGESAPWRYAGTNGLWDGIENVSGTFEVIKPETPEIDGLEITWANLQWWASDAISAGNYFEAGSCVYVDGLTNLETPGVDASGIEAQIGYSSSSDPTTGEWIWNDAWWNGDWGDNFYFQGTTPAVDAPGTYYWTFRFRLGDGDWVYAGQNGLYDASTSPLLTFSVN